MSDVTTLRAPVDWSRYRTLTLDRRPDGVLLITVATPEGAPPASLTRRHTEISGIWRDVADDPDVRVAVITGEADRFWTVEGSDGVEEMLAGTGDHAATVGLIREGLANVHGMVDCDKPIVSAINGEAMGSGLAVALLADISVAATEARLVDGHLLQGITAGDHAVLLWPLLCGLATAKLHLLASEPLTGAIAERVGLVSRAVPREDVLPTALAYAERMAAGPQLALRWTKRALNHWLRTATPAFEASLGFEALSFFGPDLVEALTALVEQRPARFRADVAW